LAPLAVNAMLKPEQMDWGDGGVIVMVGAVFTVTVTVCVFIQPLAAVPVTV
jgi:hypothetical protein